MVKVGPIPVLLYSFGNTAQGIELETENISNCVLVEEHCPIIINLPDSIFELYPFL